MAHRELVQAPGHSELVGAGCIGGIELQMSLEGYDWLRHKAHGLVRLRSQEPASKGHQQ